MLVLGIDTSTKTGGLGLYDDHRGLIGEMNLALEQTHSERLMPMMEQLLKACGFALGEVDGIAVAVGPGSFTGVRIGVTTAKTLAQVLEKPLVGVSTLEATARNLAGVTGRVCPIFDARNRRVYTAPFQGTGRDLVRLQEDGSCTIDELVQELNGQSLVYFVGDAVSLYQQMLTAELGEAAVFPPHSTWMPRGGVVAELGNQAFLRGETVDLFALAPNYLKPAEAEVTWQKKHGSR